MFSKCPRCTVYELNPKATNLPFSIERGVVLARRRYDPGVLGMKLVLMRELPCAMR